MNRMEKKFLCVACVGMIILAVHMAYGMELGGFGIDVGVGTGDFEADWNGDADSYVDSNVGNDIGNDNIGSDISSNVTGGSESNTGNDMYQDEKAEPEVEVVPEVEVIPEVEVMPGGKTELEVEVESEVEAVPKVETKPEVEIVSKDNQIAGQKSKLETKTKIKQETKQIQKTDAKQENKPVSETDAILEEQHTTEMPVSMTPEPTPLVTSIEIMDDEKEQLKVLEYYEEQRTIKKQKLKCFQYEAYVNIDEEIIFTIDSDKAIHILSFRIDGKECKWNLADQRLTGQNTTDKTEIYVEILYLCEEKEECIRLTER